MEVIQGLSGHVGRRWTLRAEP
jgi:hypothetical protein